MAKVQSYTYTVQGAGEFPFDMLRYDSCYPATQEAVSVMAPGGPRPRLPMRSVQVTGRREPTEGRWASFGWHVMGEVRKNY